MGVVAVKKPNTFRPKDLARALKILVYGQPGAGKTYFLGTACKEFSTFGKVLVLAVDPGALTLAFDDVMNDGIEIAPIDSTDELEEWYNWCINVNAKLPVDDPERVRTIAIDGLTDISELAMLESLERTHKENPNTDPNMPRVDHHMRVAVVTRREIRRFRDLKDMHVICTALEKATKDEARGITYITPALGGKMASEAPAYFDIVGHLFTDTVKDKATGVETVVRKLRVQPDGKTLAKDRSRKLGTVIEDPSLPYIVGKITNDHTEQGAPVAADPKIKLKQFGK